VIPLLMRSSITAAHWFFCRLKDRQHTTKGLRRHESPGLRRLSSPISDTLNLTSQNPFLELIRAHNYSVIFSLLCPRVQIYHVRYGSSQNKSVNPAGGTTEVPVDKCVRRRRVQCHQCRRISRFVRT